MDRMRKLGCDSMNEMVNGRPLDFDAERSARQE
jgi:hypothetical protein